jgi:hypothetical protein
MRSATVVAVAPLVVLGLVFAGVWSPPRTSAQARPLLRFLIAYTGARRYARGHESLLH